MSSLGTLIVFLSFFTHGVAFRQCIDEHQQTIAASAEGAARNFDVPVQLLLVQGFLESHWGCDPRSNGSWGSQIENGRRHTDDGPRRAARDLAHSYQFCGTWEGAISRLSHPAKAPQRHLHAIRRRRAVVRPQAGGQRRSARWRVS